MVRNQRKRCIKEIGSIFNGNIFLNMKHSIFSCTTLYKTEMVWSLLRRQTKNDGCYKIHTYIIFLRKHFINLMMKLLRRVHFHRTIKRVLCGSFLCALDSDGKRIKYIDRCFLLATEEF